MCSDAHNATRLDTGATWRLRLKWRRSSWVSVDTKARSGVAEEDVAVAQKACTVMDREEVKGKADQGIGQAKEALGKITGSPDMQAEGVNQQVRGKARAGVGKVRDAAGSIADDVVNKADNLINRAGNTRNDNP